VIDRVVVACDAGLGLAEAYGPGEAIDVAEADGVRGYARGIFGFWD